jgi:hypothetical protein
VDDTVVRGVQEDRRVVDFIKKREKTGPKGPTYVHPAKHGATKHEDDGYKNSDPIGTAVESREESTARVPKREGPHMINEPLQSYCTIVHFFLAKT